MPVPRRAVARAAVLSSLATLVLGACSNSESPINRTPVSGSGSASSVNGVQQITLVTGDDYRFHPATFTVHPGKVEVILKNTGKGAPHTFQVTGFPGTYVPDTFPGQEMAVTFTAPPSVNGKATDYAFVCTIHTRQGQRGVMIVLPN